MLEFKRKHPCVDCGNPDIRVLVFAHKNPRKDKYRRGDRAVSHMANGGQSWKRTLKEIAKCEVLCSNCHMIRHWENGMRFHKKGN